MATGTTIWTVGHGTATADTFTEVLRRAGIATVVDVRRFPASRRHSHFNREAMGDWLAAGDVAYRWLEALGGRRRGDANSPNVALRNVQFRAYADHMASAEFTAGVTELLAVAACSPVTVMCAESVWWRCHRRLLADHLILVEGVAVEHVFHDGHRIAHPLTSGARASGGHLVYDGIT
jgi:uncharacterized protein (DUF488 family)